MLRLFFCLFCVKSYYLFVPRFFLQKKRFSKTLLDDYNQAIVNTTTTTYTNNTEEEQIQKFIEYMKLKTFDHTEIEVWDSGEIEWEV